MTEQLLAVIPSSRAARHLTRGGPVLSRQRRAVRQNCARELTRVATRSPRSNARPKCGFATGILNVRICIRMGYEYPLRKGDLNIAKHPLDLGPRVSRADIRTTWSWGGGGGERGLDFIAVESFFNAIALDK